MEPISGQGNSSEQIAQEENKGNKPPKFELWIGNFFDRCHSGYVFGAATISLGLFGGFVTKNPDTGYLFLFLTLVFLSLLLVLWLRDSDSKENKPTNVAGAAATDATIDKGTEHTGAPAESRALITKSAPNSNISQLDPMKKWNLPRPEVTTDLNDPLKKWNLPKPGSVTTPAEHAETKAEPQSDPVSVAQPPPPTPQSEPVVPSQSQEPKPIPRTLGEEQRRQLVEELRKIGSNKIRISSVASYDPDKFAKELQDAFTIANWEVTRPGNNPDGSPPDKFGLQLLIPETGDKRRFLRLARILLTCGLPARLQDAGQPRDFGLNVTRLEQNSNLDTALAEMKNQIGQYEYDRFVNAEDRRKLNADLIFSDKTQVQLFWTEQEGEVQRYGSELAELIGRRWQMIAGDADINSEPGLVGIKIMPAVDDTRGEHAQAISDALTHAHIKNFVDLLTANKLTIYVGKDWRTPEEKKAALEYVDKPLNLKEAADRLRDSVSIVDRSATYDVKTLVLTFKITIKNNGPSALRMRSARELGSRDDNSVRMRLGEILLAAPNMQPTLSRNESPIDSESQSTFTSEIRIPWPRPERDPNFIAAFGKFWFMDEDRNIAELQYRYRLRKNDTGDVLTEDIPER